jgi:hypothetical protein
VECDENVQWQFAPARNRDKDELQQFEGGIEVLAEKVSQLVRQSTSCLGIAICGRGSLLQSGDIARITEKLGNEMRVRVVCETDFPDGLLTHGTLIAAAVVAQNGIPYYESVPCIELLVSKKILADRPKPVHTVDTSGWLNCLKGVEASIPIGDGVMVPANRSLVHGPNYPNLALKPGKRYFEVALDRRDVRRVEALIADGIDREKGISLQVEYELGSGRPKVTIQRPRHPNEPIVFDWAAAEAGRESRDEITRHTLEDLEAMHEERQQRRERNNMQRL